MARGDPCLALPYAIPDRRIYALSKVLEFIGPQGDCNSVQGRAKDSLKNVPGIEK
jgi:hypothetical protein